MTEAGAEDESRPTRAGSTSPLLVVLTGPSGVGKDAILDELARRDQPFHRVITCTTRPRRDTETEGIDYLFVTDEQFDALVASGGLLEHAKVYAHRSGVPRQQVIDALRAGNDVYIRTDVQGAATIKRLEPDTLIVFISLGSIPELEARARRRGADDAANIARRLRGAREEMARAAEFDYVIENTTGRLTQAADELLRIIGLERRTPRTYGALLSGDARRLPGNPQR